MLLSEDGAEPITTVEQLQTAMTQVYFQRAENELEFLAYPDLPSFPSLNSCSDETATAV